MSQPYMNSLISAQIDRTEDRKVDGKTVVYYIFEVYNNFTKKKWFIEKRYKDFDTFHSIISKLVPKCPIIPGKGFLGMKLSNDELNHRKTQLDYFVKACVERKDIINNKEFRDFIEIDRHSPETSNYTHSFLNEFDGLPLGVRDFVYSQSEGLCFVACSDMNIVSRIDSYVTNVNLPWEKNTDSHLTVGAAFVLKATLNESTNQITFEKLWAKSFPVQTGIICWDQMSNTLAVGLDDGRILFYKTAEKDVFTNFEQISELKPHKDRVMGIAIDSKLGYIYSVSTDKKFIVSEANFQSSYTKAAQSTHGFTNLIYDKKNERIFASNEMGTVSAFSVSSFPPILLQSINISDKSSIRGFHLDVKKHFIFSGTLEGHIQIIDVGLPGKERLMKEISSFAGNKKIRIIRYISKRNELITGDGNGRIVIFSIRTGESVYAWEAHKGEITQIQYIDDKRILITGAKDKKMKIWQLPEKWIDEEIEKFEKDEIKHQKDVHAMLKIQKKLTSIDNEDSDDDLNGWDFKKL